MIERKNLLSIPFYKKTHFFGSEHGMHYQIKRAERTQDGSEETTPCFDVTVWPGPYCMEKTDPSLFIQKQFDFSTQGLDDICDWLNGQYEEKIDTWKQVSMWN